MSEPKTDPYGPPNMLQRLDQNVLAIIRSFGEKALAGVNLERRETAAKMLDVYRNDFQGHVNEALRAMFAPENFADLRLFPHTSTNVLERVVRETSLLYDEPATRYLKGADGEEDADRATSGGRIGELLTLTDAQLLEAEGELGAEGTQPATPAALPAGGEGASVGVSEPGAAEATPFDRWLEAADLDTLWAEAYRLARFNPCVWLKPEVREGEDGKPRLVHDLYTPATADVIVSPTDRTRALAWYTWRDEPKTSVVGNVLELLGKAPELRRVFHVWTPATYFQVDEKGKEVRPPKPNPLGRLPVVALKLGLPADGSYYLDGVGGDLYDATIEICAMRTIQNRAFRDTFKQLAIGGGKQEDVPDGQVMGNPALPIWLGEDATADVLDFEPALASMSATITEREQGIATKYGISPDAWRMSGSVQSGFAKRLDKSEVLKQNRGHRKYLAAAEQDLYRLCALVSKQEGTSGIPNVGMLDPEVPMVVDFAEPRFDEEPDKQASADARQVELGVTSILDLVMRENPDLTEEEAIRLLARNRAVNDRFLGKQGASLMELLALPQGKTPPAAPGAPGAPPGAGPPASGAPPKPTAAPPARGAMPMRGMPPGGAR